MEGLAKSAQSTQPIVAPVHQNTEGASSNEHWQEIPMDIYKYFNVDIVALDDNTLNKLKFIKSWAEEGLEDKNIGNILEKIRNEERKMGSVDIGVKRYNRMYDYAKLTMNINKLLKQRDEMGR